MRTISSHDMTLHWKFSFSFRFLRNLIFLIFISCTAKAQFIYKPKKPIQNDSVWPDKYENTELKDSIPFSDIRIIDSRYDTVDIGFSYAFCMELKGVSREDGWKQIIKNYYHPLCLTGKDTLLIQLEKLSIQENLIRDTNFTSVAATIRAKLFKGKQDNYSYLGTADSLFTEKFSYHRFNSHKHGKHFNYEFWDYFLLKLLDVVISKSLTLPDSLIERKGGFFTMKEIVQEGLSKRDKPILKTDSLAPGFYRDFSEFVNNHPTFTYVNEETLKKLLAVMHYRVDNSIYEEAPDTTYWGYCDGKNIYIRHAFDFFQMERKDAAFYLSPTMDANRRDAGRAGWNLLIGLAALTTSVATASGPEFGGFNAIKSSEIPVVVVDCRGIPALGIELDWDTGNISY
jgi:hypothetical protein